MVGGHFDKKLNFRSGRGGGFEVQYRVNFNRDSSVQFQYIEYWGPYIEYDKIKIDQYQYYQPTITERKQSILNIGVLMGGKFNIGNSILIDMFLGIGIANYKRNESDHDHNITIPFFKWGAQFGFTF